MKAKVYGLTVGTGSGITLKEFHEHLKSENGTLQSLAGDYHYRLMAGEHEKFFVYLLVSIHDTRLFMNLTGEEVEQLKIEVFETPEGSAPMDFNALILHPETGHGLYLHYHRSVGFGRLNEVLYSKFSRLRAARIDAETKLAKTEKERKAVLKKYPARKQFKLTVMLMEKDFKALIAGWKQIKSLEIIGETFNFGSRSPLAPLDGLLSRRSERFVFDLKVRGGSKVKSAVASVVESSELTDAKAEGIDALGNAVFAWLSKNRRAFEEFDFDEIAAEMGFRLGAFDKSPLVARLLAVAKEDTVKKLLGTRVRP